MHELHISVENVSRSRIYQSERTMEFGWSVELVFRST
jgi:hypothetical protein